MIVRPRTHWLRMLFMWRGSVISRILPQLGVSTAIAIIVTLTHGAVFGHKVGLTAVPFTLLGITLAIFLGFRNTVSYDRYWEARKLWGALLIESRNATRLVLSRSQAPAAEQREFIYGLIAFAHAVKQQLRNSADRGDLQRLLAPAWLERLNGARFGPTLILLRLGEQIGRWARRDELDTMPASDLNLALNHLTESLGGLERIASTPIPFAYSVLLHRTIYLYSFLLPFGLIDSIGPMTAVIVAFVSYTFFALDALAEQIEEPFGLEPNDLALDAMCRGIEISLREMLGETELPPFLEPRDYVLS